MRDLHFDVVLCQDLFFFAFIILIFAIRHMKRLEWIRIYRGSLFFLYPLGGTHFPYQCTLYFLYGYPKSKSGAIHTTLSLNISSECTCYALRHVQAETQTVALLSRKRTEESLLMRRGEAATCVSENDSKARRRSIKGRTDLNITISCKVYSVWKEVSNNLFESVWISNHCAWPVASFSV